MFALSSKYFRQWKFPTARDHPLMFSLVELGPVMRVVRGSEVFHMTKFGPAPRTKDRQAYFAVADLDAFEELKEKYKLPLGSYQNGTKRVNITDFELFRHTVPYSTFVPERERDEMNARNPDEGF